MDKQIYKQKQGAIPVIIVSYVILIVLEYLDGGMAKFNWFGVSFLGVFVVLGILRIEKFGTVKIDGDSLRYYNWRFHEQRIAFGDIREVEVTGLWLNSLKVYRGAKNDSRPKEILLGTFTGRQLKSMIETLQTKNDRIVIGKRLSKMLKNT